MVFITGSRHCFMYVYCLLSQPSKSVYTFEYAGVSPLQADRLLEFDVSDAVSVHIHTRMHVRMYVLLTHILKRMHTHNT